jgi:hypothetical protein
MEKQRMLLLPKSFIESYLQDLDDEDKQEIMFVIFNWFLEIELQPIKSKLVKVLFNNLLPILEGHKANYVNGSKGGAPKGNNNAKKTTIKTTETTPLVLENNHRTTPVDKINNPKEKEKEKDKDKEKDKEKDIDIFSFEAQKLAEQYLNNKNHFNEKLTF